MSNQTNKTKLINKSKITKIALFILFFTIIFLAISNISAANIYVATNGSDDNSGESIDDSKLSIKNATDTVGNNEIIYIGNGTYTGSNNKGINITKNITYIGESKENVIIDGERSGRLFYISKGLNVTFINITFMNAYITGTNNNGSAIYNNGSKVTINGSSFINNTAYNGGAIYNNNGTNFTINENTSFINNSASSYGGAIANTGANFSIDNNGTFVDNSANYGGAISNSGVNFSVGDNSTFVDNSASNYYGGAITNDGVNFSVGDNSIFVNNSASTSGGAIINGGANFSVGNNGTFVNNSATSGGAIYNNGGANFTLGSSGTFVNNSASSYGGAILNSGVNFTVGTGSVFVNNSAINSDGGAIYSTGVNFTVRNNGTFVNNSAKRNGGDIYTSTNLTVNYNRFYNNTGNAQVYVAGGTVNLNYNWWGNNTDPRGNSVLGTVTLSNYFIVDINVLNIDYSQNTTTLNYSFHLNNNGAFTVGNIPVFNGTVNATDGYEDTYISKLPDTYVLNFTPEVGELVTFTVDGFVSTLFNLYVNATGGNDGNSGAAWSDAFQSIQKALEVAGYGATIHVAGGNYNNSNVILQNNTNLTIYRNITIIGETSLSGEEVILNALNNGRIFFIANGTNVTLINLTFTNGKLTGTNNNGGAIYNNGSKVTITGFNFINNTAYDGGAIYNNNGTNFFISENTSFINNTASVSTI
ncbi:beta strand repeat-containing protein [Methanobrevibacter filiformis]|uniref:Putative outer membrane protein pmp6 n=1 Tax=Methanobrevibacter filiformis TaxID=55758 RepID=A0A166A7C9_9EURY|nr:hypothetical protein [Methanobrevibacter filiformis]KZX11664.1 putative outer membrane protein pmp6 precursor [Methanobrevibacter filiformis]